MNYIPSRQKQIKAIIASAIEHFNKKEQYLIANDLSERCICAKFSTYLTEEINLTEFSGYDVDVEYNRWFDGQDRSIKRIDDNPITVDLIVHKRGSDFRHGFTNLVCVEMKKSTNRHGCVDDEQRLEKLVNADYGYCYQSGFMILINIKLKKLEIKKEFPIS